MVAVVQVKSTSQNRKKNMHLINGNVPKPAMIIVEPDEVKRSQLIEQLEKPLMDIRPWIVCESEEEADEVAKNWASLEIRLGPKDWPFVLEGRLKLVR